MKIKNILSLAFIFFAISTSAHSDVDVCLDGTLQNMEHAKVVCPNLCEGKRPPFAGFGPSGWNGNFLRADDKCNGNGACGCK